MKKLLLLFLPLSAWATANVFTPFYLISGGGDNLNSGSTPDATANTTYTSKVTANGWDGVSVFTVAAGNPSTDTGVTNGAFASIYVTSGSVTSAYIARITNTTTTTFTMDRAAFSGTPPAADATGATSAKIGGAWSGPLIPQTNCIFPWGFVSGSMTNTAGDPPMVNAKGTWFVTNTLVENCNNGWVWFKGYTNYPGDGGLANVCGSNGIAAYNLMRVTGSYRGFSNFNFATNGNSGAAATQWGVYATSAGNYNLFYRCVFHDCWISGVSLSGNAALHTCEAWNCDLSNTLGESGIRSVLAGNQIINCISHHNTGANASGFKVDQAQMFYGCIAATNGGDGFYTTSDALMGIVNSSFWGNGGSGINMAGASGTAADPMSLLFVNNSFAGNTLAAITNSGAAAIGYYSGVLFNNGFGSGSVANGAGDIEARLKGCLVSNSVTYASGQTPWTAPVTGNFSITSTTAGAKGAGYGKYNDTFPGYGGTVAFPDIGSAQSSSVSSGGGGTAGYGFAQ